MQSEIFFPHPHPMQPTWQVVLFLYLFSTYIVFMPTCHLPWNCVSMTASLSHVACDLQTITKINSWHSCHSHPLHPSTPSPLIQIQPYSFPPTWRKEAIFVDLEHPLICWPVSQETCLETSDLLHGDYLQADSHGSNSTVVQFCICGW